ncbi:MAG TPA: DUF6351 family protein [Nocardioidaceae bacterium]|nr:DUF6351 family protein [Nocardioidaceae bacterium]
MTWSRRRSPVLIALVALGLAAPLGALPSASPVRAQEDRPPLTIQVVSNRADLVSAGEALVAVRLPRGTRPRSLRIRLNGRDVTRMFGLRRNGRYEGLVRGLRVGRNRLVASAPGRTTDRVVITNHPNGGPVFSGPQVRPWVCQESARDAQCNQPPRYELMYRSSVTGQFHPYDPKNPPADLAETTTDQGHRVPFVIRVETGYQNRDQYKIATLYRPGRRWTAWAPQKQWNHKVLITHGQSCGIDRQSGEAPSVTSDLTGNGAPVEALSRGYVVMSTALNNAGHNCNLVTQAESMVMAKERIVERYGRIRFTIGTGCSGGSLTQQQVANAYPGIYQGILPQCSFPDAWTTGQQLVDYHLLRAYLESPDRWAPGVAWEPQAIAAVEGHPNHVNSVILDSLYWTSLADPDSGCAGVSDEQLYDAETNPDGVRCTLHDYMVNVVGRRRPADWGPQEKQVGHGFGGLPVDNVGVQYGLQALQQGRITAAQFVDLNAKVGGSDIDLNPRPERFEANQPALRNSYLSGGVNSANNLDRVAIIDLRGPDPGAFHDAYRSFAVRARLEREHGHYRNHVLWYGAVPLVGDTSYTRDGLVAMDRWLTSVERDRRRLPLARKIVANRPADLQDRCTQLPGVEQVDVPGVGVVCELPDVQTRYGTPRTVAGEGIETDVQKCTLRPLRRTDYYPVELTDAQWGRLREAFPDGVCNWEERGVDQVGARAWQTYQRLDGSVVYGGRRLGRAPGRSGDGWTSRSFAVWRSGR